jgi:hypothetical protein
VVDQFGNDMVSQPTFTFNSTGVGSTTSAGIYSSSAVGSANVTASAGSFSASTGITVAATSLYYRNDIINSGTNAVDSSGNGYNGTITGTYGSTYGSTPGEIGNALSLSDSSSSPAYVTAPTSFATALSSMTNFTLSAWVDPANLSEWSRVFDFGDNTTLYMFLTTSDANGRPKFAITTSSDGGEQSVESNVALTTNTWNFLSVTLSGSVATMYLDGVEVGTAGGFTLNPSSLGVTTLDYLGKSQWSADPAFNGDLDDFRVYGTALSGASIAQMYSQGVAASTAEPSGVTAAADADGTISVAWTNNATGDTAYLLERATDSTFDASLVSEPLPPDSTSYLDTNVNTGSTYFYRVTAIMPGDLNAGPVVAATSATAVLPSWLANNSIAVWNPSTQILTVTGAASVIADPGAAEPLINASGPAAVLTLNPASGTEVELGGLSLSNGASATLTSLGSARSLTNYHLLVIGTPGASVAPTFTIDSTSTLDLADNDMAILYGSGTSPLSTVSTELSQAYDGGLWDQPGLTSSVAKTTAGVTALAYGEASVLGLSTFDGLTLGGNAVLVKYTLVGDANLDGSVDFSDFSVLQNHMGQPGPWSSGDFNYDGTVNFNDFSLLQNNYNKTLASLLPDISPAIVATIAPATPKPATSTVTHAPSPSAKISTHPPKPRAPVAAHEASRQMRTS